MSIYYCYIIRLYKQLDRYYNTYDINYILSLTNNIYFKIYTIPIISINRVYIEIYT